MYKIPDVDVKFAEMIFSVHLCIVGVVVAVAVTDHQRCLRVSWLLWTVLTVSVSVLNTTQTRAAALLQCEQKYWREERLQYNTDNGLSLLDINGYNSNTL